MQPSLAGATCLTWLQFRRALGEPNSRFIVTRSTGLNSPAIASFAGSTPKKCIFDYASVQSDLTHFSHNTYYITPTRALIVCFPGFAGKPPGWVQYTPINEVPA